MEKPAVGNASVERSIRIVIDSIENLTVKEGTGVSFVVIHNDAVLGESIPVTIDPSFQESSQIYDVNFAVELSFVIGDHGRVDSLVSTPVLVKVTHAAPDQPDTVGSNAESKRRAKPSAQRQTSQDVIGFCSLDLMPILLGERSLTERLMVETASLSFDADAISWQNLPVLTVTITYDDAKIFPVDAKVNFLSITVESIYNPPRFFAEDEEYKAATIMYIDNEFPENLIFGDGVWTKYRDIERTKRWQSLSKLQSRARLSKCKLGRDYANIRDTLTVKLNVEERVLREQPRIEWNFMSRKVIYDAGLQIMQKHINEHRYWPFQFTVVVKSAEDSVKLKMEGPTRRQLYQCYVDMSELLLPGKTSTRVMAQLYTYNPSDMAEKTGLETDILDTDPWNGNSREQEQKNMKLEVSRAVPLISENGEPVFVIIEITLYYPIIPRAIETEFSDIIEKMMMPRPPKPRYAYSGDMAEEQYATCIRKMAEIITESYRDELTCFTQYLYKTGVYLNVRSSLKAKVIMLLDQKFNVHMSNVESVESQNFVASTYTYLVEQMHLVLNKIVESRLADDSSGNPISTDLYFYAEEAYELGHTDDARRHYRAAIAVDERNPVAWTRYAIFHLKIGDVERAKECSREAILLDRRDKIAYVKTLRDVFSSFLNSLSMYGLILAGERNYRDAEVFLRIVTDFYPRFVEGWVNLHLFYIRTDYCPGIDPTLRIARKCLQDADGETEISGENPLSWTTIHCPRDSVYTIAATFLLKLHLCDFAGVALAEEMSHVGRATHVLYYLAVQHYLSRRYQDALLHLEEAKRIYGMDYSISSLMGHCHFQEGDFEEAIRRYEFASTVFNRPDDLHLVWMRMGLCYEDVGDYERALRVFLGACDTSPTAETWLGAGIAFYELRRFKEAEIALIEANEIDNRNVTVWKYLCLLNAALQRRDEFQQCYRQATRDNADFSLEKRSLKPRRELPTLTAWIAMKSACALFILVLLQAMLTTNCGTRSSDVSRHRTIEEDDVPRVKIKVFRSPTEEADGESFATWGYWIKQPNNK
ncbi:uncharacterized protein LOC116849292 [Odontomachus brunneus]|uniref:uncharacterized protein LOC116849292 n=1 Tax=Odontomachus brunneus TaxID=486640 RepID=UPI0013F1932E|nr:uncharacterized protein LOC116849292 [Odontomachus brunneus]